MTLIGCLPATSSQKTQDLKSTVGTFAPFPNVVRSHNIANILTVVARDPIPALDLAVRARERPTCLLIVMPATVAPNPVVIIMAVVMVGIIVPVVIVRYLGLWLVGLWWADHNGDRLLGHRNGQHAG
jgi:hypothetical protein